MFDTFIYLFIYLMIISLNVMYYWSFEKKNNFWNYMLFKMTIIGRNIPPFTPRPPPPRLQVPLLTPIKYHLVFLNCFYNCVNYAFQ